MSTTKLPLASLPLPTQALILQHHLTPDPLLSSPTSLRHTQHTNPSLQRRARLLRAGHFSHVSPLPLPFPYRIPDDEVEGGKDDEGEYVEKWLSEREATVEVEKADERGGLRKFGPEKGTGFPVQLLAIAPTCLEDCLPNLDVGDAISHLGPGRLAVPQEVAIHANGASAEQDPARAELTAILSGQNVLMRMPEEGSEESAYAPWSLRYSGHQFGVWAGQLGDGRAISILETPNEREPGTIWELQLKGAGRTPFSRTADGLAVLRSSIREFLGAEAMHALHIPTTRSLSLTHLPTLPVSRETTESAAVLCRLAPSFLRIGSFEAMNPPRQVFLFGAGGMGKADWEGLRGLGEWVARLLGVRGKEAKKGKAKAGKEEKEAKEVKETKETKEAEVAKDSKDAEDAEDAKEATQAKDAEEAKEAVDEGKDETEKKEELMDKDGTEGKDGKEGKEEKEGKVAKVGKEAKVGKAGKGAKDGEDPKWGRELAMEVARRNARMLAGWQAYGFMHGVMNTDNISVLGLTIDYGPYAFMDVFDSNHICNHTDQEGRYAFRLQPTMIIYALRALRDALAPLVGREALLGHAVPPGWADEASDEELAEWKTKGMEEMKGVEGEVIGLFEREYWGLMRKRLGLRETVASDWDSLIRPLLSLLEQHSLDFHITLRTLCSFRPSLFHSNASPSSLDDFLSLLTPSSTISAADARQRAQDAWKPWLSSYAARLESEKRTDAEREKAMRACNPRFVLRQWVLEEVIGRVQEEPEAGRGLLMKVLEMATHPFEPWGAEDEPERGDAELEEEVKEERRYCGMGAKRMLGFQCSCSS